MVNNPLRGARVGSTLFAATVAALAFALPGAAVSTGAATLIAGPVTVRDYQMNLYATHGSLTVSLERKAGQATQYHQYTFKLSATALKIAPDLSSASLTTGTKLAGFGSIKMNFVQPGKLTSMTECGATYTGRPGQLTGTLRLVLDNTYFKTVVEQAIPAKLTRGNGTANCGSTSTGKKSGLTLTAMSPGGGATGPVFDATKSPANGVSEMFIVSEQRAPAIISHSIVAPAGASAFTAASDLTSAHVDGTPGAPFLSGALTFASATPAMAAAGCKTGTGQLTGSLIGHFDSIGDQTAGTTGILMDCAV